MTKWSLYGEGIHSTVSVVHTLTEPEWQEKRKIVKLLNKQTELK